MRFRSWLGAVIIMLAPARALAAEASLAETKLPNGLRVVVDESHHVPIVSIAIRYGVGRSEDPDTRNGLTELTMQMMAHHTEHIAENAFDDIIDRAGGKWGYETNADDTEFYARLPSNVVETAFWMFSDQMGFFKSTVDDASIARRVQLLSADRGEHIASSPLGLANELLPGELFPAGHPYLHIARANDAVGLASVTPAEIGAFVDQYFVPQNAVLVIVGDVKAEKMFELANKWFAQIPAGRTIPQRPIPQPKLHGQVQLEIAARVERPLVRMTWATPAQFAPGDADLDIVASILHGYRIARLSWSLITQLKVAGEITAHQSSHRRGSTFTITASVTPNHTPQQVADAIDDVLKILQTTQPPNDDDMAGSLASALMGRTLEMEGSEYRARQISSWAVRTGTADYWQNDMHRYETDPAHVQTAAQRYLPLDRRVITFITPSTTAPVSGQLLKRTVK